MKILNMKIQSLINFCQKHFLCCTRKRGKGESKIKVLNEDPFCDYEEDFLQICMEATDVHNIQYFIFL